MDFFDDWIKERSESVVGEVRSSIDTYGVVLSNLASTEDALFEGTLPVILLVLKLLPYLSREMLGEE